MAYIDLKTNIAVRNALNIAAISTNTTTNGIEIDTLGFGSCTFEIITGARTDGTVTPAIQESDVSGSYSGSVSTDFLIGTTTAAALNTAQSRSTIGYVGKKRYVRLQLVSTSVTTGLTAGATAILGDAIHSPTI
jgi:hypothetical protein